MKTLFMKSKILLLFIVLFSLVAWNKTESKFQNTEPNNNLATNTTGYGYVGRIDVIYNVPKSSPAVQAAISNFKSNAALNLNLALQMLEYNQYVTAVHINFDPNNRRIGFQQHSIISYNNTTSPQKDLWLVYDLICPGGGGTIGIGHGSW